MKNPRQYFRRASWLTVFICLPWAVAEGQEPYLLATVKAPLEATNLHPDITHITMTIRLFESGGGHGYPGRWGSGGYLEALDDDAHYTPACDSQCMDLIKAEATVSVPVTNGTINEVVEIPIMYQEQNEYGANYTLEELVDDSWAYVLHVWANDSDAFKEDGSSANPAYNLVSANFAHQMKAAKRSTLSSMLTEELVDEE